MNKITKNIGTLEGRILVFGGVYSNYQSLEELMKIADEKKIAARNIIYTGDIVGYCAQPEKCLQSIKEWGIHSILGNVEIQLREGEEDCGCNFEESSPCDLLSKQWYPFAQSQVSQDAIKWLNELPHFINFQYANHNVAVLHGSYFETSEFIFKSTPWIEKQKNFHATNSDVILAGHCGLPFADVQQGKYWLNAGVIGMPANDGTPRVWYMILDINNNKLQFEHHCLNYDYQKAAQLMRNENLPSSYACTLENGIWDNCDILPHQETQLQGQRINFL